MPPESEGIDYGFTNRLQPSYDTQQSSDSLAVLTPFVHDVHFGSVYLPLDKSSRMLFWNWTEHNRNEFYQLSFHVVCT